MRVGQKQKKIDINIPKLDSFIHKIYINVARKIYKNVYLFEINIQPLQVQKNFRELEIIVQECILNTIRENIPVEAILKAYMDETVEEDVVEEIKEQIIEEPIKKQIQNGGKVNTDPINSQPINPGSRLTFNDIDYIKTQDGLESSIIAPKNIERLEKLSEQRNEQRKLENEDDDTDKIKISDQPYTLSSLDVHTIEEPKIELFPDLLQDIEILE